jgi:serine/threonine-protein kinase RsbW
MQEVSRLKVKAVLENVSLAIECVDQSAQRAGFGGQVLEQIKLGVDEACANVVDHAYKGMDRGDMEVSCCLDGQDFVVFVRDWGTSFDPERVQEPDIEAPLEERALGGLGVFLIKQVMDRVEYRSDPVRGNELMMVKRAESTD